MFLHKTNGIRRTMICGQENQPLALSDFLIQPGEKRCKVFIESQIGIFYLN